MDAVGTQPLPVVHGASLSPHEGFTFNSLMLAFWFIKTWLYIFKCIHNYIWINKNETCNLNLSKSILRFCRYMWPRVGKWLVWHRPSACTLTLILASLVGWGSPVDNHWPSASKLCINTQRQVCSAVTMYWMISPLQQLLPPPQEVVLPLLQ